MRTPGRCTNLEGCWISASHRDVWLSVGEDFVCPNCGGNLSAPPKQAVSVRGLRQAAITGVAVTMGLAAMAVAAVRLSAVPWAGQPLVVAALRAPVSLFNATVMHHAYPRRAAAGHAPSQRVAAVAPIQIALPPDAPPRNTAQAPQPAGTDSSRGSAAHWAIAAGSNPGRRDSWVQPAPPVVLYAAIPETPPPSRPQAESPIVQEQAKAEPVAAPAPITMISQAAFVLDPSPQRALVLPITFGKPIAPEDDAEPVTRRWRYHGFTSARHSGFLPGPGTETTPALCPAPALLK